MVVTAKESKGDAHGEDEHFQKQLANDLAELPLFADVCSQAVEAISRSIRKFHAKGGLALSRDGESTSSLMWVRDGEVDAHCRGQFVQHVPKGAYIGETRLLGIKRSNGVTLTARSDCSVCELTRTCFLKALENFPADMAKFEKMRVQNQGSVSTGIMTQTCSLLCGLSMKTLIAIDAATMEHLFFPGEVMLHGDLPGDELYILVQGRASVECGNTKTKTIVCGENQAACFGELTFLGMKDNRSSNVVAQTPCLVRVLKRPVLARMLGHQREAIHLNQVQEVLRSGSIDNKEFPYANFGQTQSKGILYEMEICEGFLNQLSEKCEKRVFLHDQKLIDASQGCVLGGEDCMFLITSGRAKVLESGANGKLEETKRLASGDIVGENVVLGLFNRTAGSTVIAVGMCSAYVLSLSTIVDGLRQFPEEKGKVLLLAFANAEVAPKASPSPRRRSIKDAVGDGCSAAGKPVAPAARRGSQMRRRTSGLQHSGTRRSVSKDVLQHSATQLMDSGEKAEVCPQSQLELLKVIQEKRQQEIVQQAMRASPLFSGVSDAFVEKMRHIALYHIFLPGATLTDQGDKGESMFIMVSGEAAVLVTKTQDEKNVQVGMLSAGSIFGELTMLGVSPTRTATVTARTICTVWEVTQDQALTLFEDFPDQVAVFENIVVRNLEHSVLLCIKSVPLFRDFDSKFLTLVYMYCERRAFWGGASVVKQGEIGLGLYIINRGIAALEANGCTVSQCSDGYFFGSGMMLGFQKVSPCTLVALNTCHVIIISRESYVLARDRYPAHEAHKELEVTQKVELRKLIRAVEEVCTTKNRVVRRSILTSISEPSDEMVVQRCYTAWQDWTLHEGRRKRAWRKIRCMNKLATEAFTQRAEAGRELRKLSEQSEAEAAFDRRESDAAVALAMAARKSRKSGQSGASQQDPIDELLGSPRSRRPTVPTPRILAATEKHFARVQGAAQSESPSSARPSPKSPRGRVRVILEESSDDIEELAGTKFPPLLPHLAQKPWVDASTLQPILRSHVFHARPLPAILFF